MKCDPKRLCVCVFVFSWLQMWPQDYWQSLDQAEALVSLINHNESDPGLLWQHMHRMALSRSSQ